MQIIPWKKRGTKNELRSLRDSMGSVLGDFFGGLDFEPFVLSRTPVMAAEWSLPLELQETEKEIVVKADVPGVDSKDISLDIEDRVLTIKGEKKSEKEEKDESGKCCYSERTYGSFARSVSLSSEVDMENVKAALKDGVLTITLPKKEDEKKKQIKINIEDAA